MMFSNPTQIRIGPAATFFGRACRVVGRAVLGVQDQGATYYWNEFNLESADGNYATLVFEETGVGGKWRLFEMFNPRVALTSTQAAQKCVGDRINFDDDSYLITRTACSRIYFVDGQVPEGYVVGQHANYFNAEEEDRMLVVSWTGSEIEFYKGNTIPCRQVASAFCLHGLVGMGFILTGGRRFFNGRVLGSLLVIALLGALFSGFCSAVRFPGTPAPVVVLPATPSPLAPGEAGFLHGTHYRIVRHVLTEVAEAGLRYSQHEYELLDDNNNSFSLFSGIGSDAKSWRLLAPMDLTPLFPQEAATFSVGQSVMLGGESARITKLFRMTIRETDPAASGAFKPGDVAFGFSASIKSSTLMVRWDATHISGLEGASVSDQSVKTAFEITTSH